MSINRPLVANTYRLTRWNYVLQQFGAALALQADQLCIWQPGRIQWNVRSV